MAQDSIKNWLCSYSTKKVNGQLQYHTSVEPSHRREFSAVKELAQALRWCKKNRLGVTTFDIPDKDAVAIYFV